MDGDRFDQLARFLSRGVHRRTAVAVLAALALLSGEATAKSKHKRHGRASGGNGHGGPGGNSACDAFCHSVFGDTAAAGQCTSDAAHGAGLCYTCGPASPHDNGQQLCGTVCIPTTDCCIDKRHVTPGNACDRSTICCGSNTCVDLSSDNNNCGSCGAKCAGGQICQSGSCCTPPSPEQVCTDPCSCQTVHVQCGPPIDCGKVTCPTEGWVCSGGTGTNAPWSCCPPGCGSNCVCIGNVFCPVP